MTAAVEVESPCLSDNSVRIFAYTLSSTGGRMSARHEELANSAKLMGRGQTHTSDVNSVSLSAIRPFRYGSAEC